MQNFFQPANVIDLIAPRDLKSGDGFFLGKFFGVATKDAKQGAVIPTLIEGGVGLKKAAGATPNPGDATGFNETTQVLGGSGAAVGIIIHRDHPDDATYAVVKLVQTTAAAGT